MGEARKFEAAPVLPIEWAMTCPTCGGSKTLPGINEDDGGAWCVPVEHRFHECECGALLEAVMQPVTVTNAPFFRMRG